MDPTARFAELVRGPEDRLSLDEAALLIAAHADPGLDVDAELRVIDGLAAGISDPTLAGWRRHLFVELGFSGNVGNYYDPANSFLHQVVRRRLGLPITLSVLGMEVGRRIGLRLQGVGMPGHFLLRHTPDALADVFVDPFDEGRVFGRDGCLERFRAVNGPDTPFREAYLDPIGGVAILSRMLNNLASIYSASGRTEALEWVLRLRVALPGSLPAERREWALTLGATGRFVEAAVALEGLVEALPGDEEHLRKAASAFRARLN
ncbi:MAG: transglutaminase-like domain-containing protein [Actinomycetota bacterium]|nr:transglutaminase-like domain-containing protein [Actinomycetota bacterium]